MQKTVTHIPDGMIGVIRGIFHAATEPLDYVISMYRLACAIRGEDYDSVPVIDYNEFTMSRELADAVMRLAMDTDRRLEVRAVHGGTWMNYGWTSAS